jgi:hypothetical protein
MSETRDFPLLASWDLIKELQARIVEMEAALKNLREAIMMHRHITEVAAPRSSHDIELYAALEKGE